MAIVCTTCGRAETHSPGCPFYEPPAPRPPTDFERLFAEALAWKLNHPQQLSEGSLELLEDFVAACEATGQEVPSEVTKALDGFRGRSGEPEPSDATKLRAHLHIHYGTDWGLSDERLQEVAEREQERVRISGRRWSWKALAADALHRDQEDA